MSAQGSGPGWVPDSCTLSAGGQLSRAAEFGRLLAGAVLAAARPEPGRLRLSLRPDPETAASAAGLAAAETACCSFFTFTLTAAAGSLVLDVTVPPGRRGVLDGLARLAGAGSPA